ncbi:hypothetical protein PAMP_023310 [Pampus punctatissimus]
MSARCAGWRDFSLLRCRCLISAESPSPLLSEPTASSDGEVKGHNNISDRCKDEKGSHGYDLKAFTSGVAQVKIVLLLIGARQCPMLQLPSTL